MCKAEQCLANIELINFCSKYNKSNMLKKDLHFIFLETVMKVSSLKNRYLEKRMRDEKLTS